MTTLVRFEIQMKLFYFEERSSLLGCKFRSRKIGTCFQKFHRDHENGASFEIDAII
jgi:hypothetical protein